MRLYLEHELLQAGSAVGVVAGENLQKNNILALSKLADNEMSKSSRFYQGEPDMKIVKEGDSDGDVYLGHPVLAVVVV